MLLLPSTARFRSFLPRGHGGWYLSSSSRPALTALTLSAETCPNSASSWVISLNAYVRNFSLSSFLTRPCDGLQKIDPKEAACTTFRRHVHKLSASNECQSGVRAHDENERSRPSRSTGKSGPGTMAKSLVQIVMSLSHVKEEVYGALDKWAAFELKFPLEATMNALKKLRDKNQWHRVIQVSKWMLSKGIGKTNGTYNIMLKAYCMDGRLDDAEALWEKVITLNNRSTPKNMFSYMIHIYRKQEMPEKVIQVFEQMETFGIKPDVDMLRRVREAYNQLGIQEKQDELTKKYPLNSKQRRNEKRFAARTALKSAKIHDGNASAVNANKVSCATHALSSDDQLKSVNEPEVPTGHSETIKLDISNTISSSLSKKQLATVQNSSGANYKQPKGEEKNSSDIDFVEKIIATM